MCAARIVAAGVVKWPAGVQRPDMIERRVWKQDKTGNIGNLLLRKDRLPQPGEGEVRIAVKAVGFPLADTLRMLKRSLIGDLDDSLGSESHLQFLRTVVTIMQLFSECLSVALAIHPDVSEDWRSRSRHLCPATLQVGLNFADVFTALGLYAAAPKGDVIPGLEVNHSAIDLQHSGLSPHQEGKTLHIYLTISHAGQISHTPH